LGIAQLNERCQKVWALVFGQENRRTTLIDRVPPELGDSLALFDGVIHAFRWEHPSEHATQARRWDARAIVYPNSIAGHMEGITSGRYYTLPPELEAMGYEISMLSSQWVDGVHFSPICFDDAAVRDGTPFSIASWVSLAQNATLGAHPMVLEDGPVLPDSSLPAQSGINQ
jgi:hypothetical protein